MLAHLVSFKVLAAAAHNRAGLGRVAQFAFIAQRQALR